MRISTEALPKDIDSAVDWISGQIGAAIDKRVSGFEQQERTNPLLASHFRNHYSLEFALAKVRKYRKATGRLPKGPEYAALYSFLIPTHRIHSLLPPEVKIPFEGRLREAVNGLNGARPFAYEISIATHLMQKGWDVEFIDYSGTARFDLLARRGSVEIEVECKTTSGDILIDRFVDVLEEPSAQRQQLVVDADHVSAIHGREQGRYKFPSSIRRKKLSCLELGHLHRMIRTCLADYFEGFSVAKCNRAECKHPLILLKKVRPGMAGFVAGNF
jgi:hypothetical protein